MLELLLLALPRPAASPTRTTRFAKSSHRNCPDTVKDPAKHEPVTSGSARSPSGGLTAGRERKKTFSASLTPCTFRLGLGRSAWGQ